MNIRQQQINLLNMPQDENQQSYQDSGRNYDNRREQFSCDEIQKEMRSLKDLAGLIKNAISSDKLEDINEIMSKIQIKEPEVLYPPPPLTTNIIAQNQQPQPPQPKQPQIMKNYPGSKSIVQAQKDSNRNSNVKNSLSNTSKIEQEDNKRFLQMDDFLEQMRNKVDLGMKQTVELKNLIQGQAKPDKVNLQKADMNGDQGEWDANYFEFQKRQDKNRDEINHSQKKIHDMQNKRLVLKVEELYKELQAKKQEIEDKDKMYRNLTEKIQMKFGILQLQYEYEKDNQQNQSNIHQNFDKQNKYKVGYFIFDLKQLIIAKNLEGEEYDFCIEYEKLTKVDYKLDKERLMMLQWTLDQQQEGLKIRFQNDQELNKFDMLLYILSLNYSRFSSNSFSGYFNTEKYKWLISPFDKDYYGGGRQLDQSQIQSMSLINSANFGQGSRTFNQNNFRQDMSKLTHQERMQIMDKYSQPQSNISNQNNSEANINITGLNKSVNSPNNNSMIQEGNMNQSMLRGSRQKRSFTPVNELSLNPSENNQLMQSTRKREDFITLNGEQFYYQNMNNDKFWEKELQQNLVNKPVKIIKILTKDKFRQQFVIRVEKSQQKDQAKSIVDYDIPHFIIKKSDKKDRTIELEMKPDEKKDERIEIEIQEGKFEYFFRLFKFFCQMNLQKQKDISKAISDLHNGMIFLKYSRGSLSPHEKIFLYKYDNKRHLLISRLPSDTSGRKDKITSFTDIVSLHKDWQQGPGFKKFQKDDPRIINELCIVIQTRGKTIEILAKTQQQRDLFFSYLELINQQVNGK